MLLRIIAKFTGIEMYVTFSEAFFEAFFVPIFLNVPSSTCGPKWTKKTSKFNLFMHSPKMFCVGPIFLSQLKNLTAFSVS